MEKKGGDRKKARLKMDTGEMRQLGRSSFSQGDFPRSLVISVSSREFGRVLLDGEKNRRKKEKTRVIDEPVASWPRQTRAFLQKNTAHGSFCHSPGGESSGS